MLTALIEVLLSLMGRWDVRLWTNFGRKRSKTLWPLIPDWRCLRLGLWVNKLRSVIHGVTQALLEMMDSDMMTGRIEFFTCLSCIMLTHVIPTPQLVALAAISGTS